MTDVPEMVERVARTICRLSSSVGCACDDDGVFRCADLLPAAVARAAIEAMREPTDEMSRVSGMRHELPDGGAVTLWAVNKWPDMIDAALGKDTDK